jgi:hypothetical protein
VEPELVFVPVIVAGAENWSSGTGIPDRITLDYTYSVVDDILWMNPASTICRSSANVVTVLVVLQVGNVSLGHVKGCSPHQAM